MIIKFTKDYTGRETAMKPYKAGTQADLPTAQALELVKLGVAREMWAEIGRMYDPKPVTPAITEALQAAETSPKFDEVPDKPQPVKKPRKGKSKK
jgi:hypothetical protein